MAVAYFLGKKPSRWGPDWPRRGPGLAWATAWASFVFSDPERARRVPLLMARGSRRTEPARILFHLFDLPPQLTLLPETLSSRLPCLRQQRVNLDRGSEHFLFLYFGGAYGGLCHPRETRGPIDNVFQFLFVLKGTLSFNGWIFLFCGPSWINFPPFMK